MSQVTIFGHRDQLRDRRQRISDAIHATLVAAIGLPAEKRFHRFVGLDRENFIYPEDRSEYYTIFETPRANWGIRGVPGDELGLNYKVEV